MKQSYDLRQPNEATQKLARELVSVIIKAGATYEAAEKALETAGAILASEAKLVMPDPICP